MGQVLLCLYQLLKSSSSFLKTFFSVLNSAGIAEVLWNDSGIYTEVQGGSARACRTPCFSQDGEQVLFLPCCSVEEEQPSQAAAQGEQVPMGTPVGMGTVAAQQN